MMAVKAGYSYAESELIAQAAYFHDVGKAAIPARILSKPSALTPQEFNIIKTHTTIGSKQISDAAKVLALASIVALQHHEHMDGNGYQHLVGSDIHPYTKLIECADVLDALLSRRVYKDPWDIPSIRAYFTTQSGKQFDPAMVNVLFSILDDVLALYGK
jgi:HD-GYP domain-containing protein (c-di-GMP phosphodiesterase class II)